MLSTLFLAALLCTVSAAPGKTTQAPLLAADSPTAIPNEYLVRLNPETTDEQVEAHMNKVTQVLTISTAEESKVMHSWHIGSFRGYSVRMDDQSLEKLREMEEIMYVERNQEAHAYCTGQEDAVWGLRRTTVHEWNKGAEPNYSYDDDQSGEGVNAYVIDTGVLLQHTDFEGRAHWGKDFIDENNSGETDYNGHGTHVAGTIAGKEYGLAKNANIIAVRVLNAGGSGSYAGVISGINWVAGNHSNSPRKKSVANLSLGGSHSILVNQAIERAFEQGVIMVSAAGNEGQSACNVSPASARGISVAASDEDDVLAAFSNHDDCVEIIAPGVAIKAPWIGDTNSETKTISGTSMAAPHVAGVIAKLLSGPNPPFEPTYESVTAYLELTATKDKIDYGGRNISLKNLLIFMECL